MRKEGAQRKVSVGGPCSSFFSVDDAQQSPVGRSLQLFLPPVCRSIRAAFQSGGGTENCVGERMTRTHSEWEKQNCVCWR
ncbi:hypothetical protein NPIL_614291 [Nephila pilipes]|uniref:Uncharacterized protein n=1 Tax=Nephila pilipes TaxID=299642 RepID=A0A8X6N0Y6_NEPPI|nr:hypothetical protein NPIL_614291 [Nephila pilipes]